MGRKKIGGLRLRGGTWHIQKSVRGYGFVHESTGTGDRSTYLGESVLSLQQKSHRLSVFRAGIRVLCGEPGQHRL
jgi:hypothetical protein